jgi:hypothetical protein
MCEGKVCDKLRIFPSLLVEGEYVTKFCVTKCDFEGFIYEGKIRCL